MSKTVHLIPVGLSEAEVSVWLPAQVQAKAAQLTYYIAENAKTARAFLKLIHTQHPLQSITIQTLTDKTSLEQIKQWLLEAPEEMGVVSEAGCPAVADPGALVVKQAHQLGYTVRPWVGPNSILLALMGSGLDGQRFAFHGYPPVKPADRTKQLKQWESISRQQQQTQIMIETPYRNQALFEALVQSLNGQTRLCIASDLTGSHELIKTFTIAQWKQQNVDFLLKKHPTLFLFLASC